MTTKIDVWGSKGYDVSGRGLKSKAGAVYGEPAKIASQVRRPGDTESYRLTDQGEAGRWYGSLAECLAAAARLTPLGESALSRAELLAAPVLPRRVLLRIADARGLDYIDLTWTVADVPNPYAS